MNRTVKIMLSLLLTFDLANATVFNRTTPKTTIGTTAARNDAKCDSGYKYFEAKCYQVYHMDTYFTIAREACQRENAELVSIGSAEENAFIRNLIKEASHDEAWIGYTNENDRYEWVDKSAVSYTNWMRNKPNGEGKCVEIIPGGEWVNILCFNKIAFVCKKDPNPLLVEDNLREILAITIPASFVFIMFVFVTFLCIKSHKELEAVESQVKETIPFEIVKAAMILPMAKPPDLLDHKADEWRGRLKSISMHRSDLDLQRLSTYSTDNPVDGRPEVGLKSYCSNETSNLAGKSSSKINIMHFLNRRYAKTRGSASSLPLSKSQAKDKMLMEPASKQSVSTHDISCSRPIPTLPKSNGSLSEKRPSSETNYLSKVGQWLTESPESPIRSELSKNSSDRRKYYQQSRGSINYSKQLEEDDTSQTDTACNATQMSRNNKDNDSNNDNNNNNNKNNNNTDEEETLETSFPKNNVISVVADVNVPRNISSDIDPHISRNISNAIDVNDSRSDTSDIETDHSSTPTARSINSVKPIEYNENCDEKSNFMKNEKTRKRAVVHTPPTEQLRNDNFPSLKSINLSQETNSCDGCESSLANDEKAAIDVAIVDGSDRKTTTTATAHQELTQVNEYQLVTFV